MRITHWLKQQVANPQVVFLALVLIGALLTILYAGSMLAPVLAGIVIAYLLEGLTRKLTRLKMPRAIAVWLVFLAFMLFVVMVVFVLLPTLYNQLTQMVQQIPSMLTRGQAALMTLPEKYPELFSVEQVGENHLRQARATDRHRPVDCRLVAVRRGRRDWHADLFNFAADFDFLFSARPGAHPQLVP